MISFGSALEALDKAGVRYSLRMVDDPGRLPERGELDVWIDHRDVRRADSALAAAGFHHLATPGSMGHRFYVAFDQGRWLKLDAKIPSTGQARLPGARVVFDRRRPAALRRLGPVVAVLGPDGAGKGSLISGLRSRIPFAVTPVYLGMAKRRRGSPRLPGPRRRGQTSVWREVAGLLLGSMRTWVSLSGAYVAAWRGDVVLCDRHPIEVLAVRPNRTKVGAALERVLVGRLMPKPDAIVILDAPGSVLYRRKGEHSVDVLERWRLGYAEAFGPSGAVTISTLGSKNRTVDLASEVVWLALRKRRRW